MEYTFGRIENDSRVLEWVKNISEFHEEQSSHQSSSEPCTSSEIRQKVEQVKAMLWSMGDGEITSSAYDTAWVAMVRNLTGDGKQQFPSSLQWIIDNQLEDGSWGDQVFFSACDRIINTLACAVALKSWNICPHRYERGLLFLKENMWRLAEEEDELMPIGFEVALPSLIDIAKGLGLNFPYDAPALQDIYAKREMKLNKIPREEMHEVATTLLHSLEGMADLQWDKLLRLQNKEGSFLFSPSSTAYALMQTGDENCLRYLQKVVDKFNGGVPNVYPVDLFERLWAVDRLQRLGISRYFEAEIKHCLDYISRYWTEKGICWARDSNVQDIDDTAMAFRLLRLHGYSVSPDVFGHFEKDGEFFCFAGQSSQAVTGMCNLNRASQLMFPGEEILEMAKNFSYKFLKEKQAAKQLLDKWIIMRDLPGEVEYGLDFPFHASLPRVESRWYVEQYGGGDDVWIGKTLYRMPYVSNAAYLELAKADFNRCQSIHQLEWFDLKRWYNESALEAHGVSRRSVLKAYFLAAASIFEPDRSAERLGWARTAVLADSIARYFHGDSCTDEARHLFLQDFLNCRSLELQHGNNRPLDLVGSILGLLDLLTATSDRRLRRQQPPHIFRQNLSRAWEEWISTWTGEEENKSLLLVRTVELCAGRVEAENEPARQEYTSLVRLTTSVCRRLRMFAQAEKKKSRSERDAMVESEMQELTKSVLENANNGLNIQTKQTFLTIAKTFYYTAHCSTATLNKHIAKVLFEQVE